MGKNGLKNKDFEGNRINGFKKGHFGIVGKNGYKTVWGKKWENEGKKTDLNIKFRLNIQNFFVKNLHFGALEHSGLKMTIFEGKMWVWGRN